MIRLLRWVAIVTVLAYISYLAWLAPGFVYKVVAVLAHLAAAYVLARAWPRIVDDWRAVMAALPRVARRGRGDYL